MAGVTKQKAKEEWQEARLHREEKYDEYFKTEQEFWNSEKYKKWKRLADGIRMKFGFEEHWRHKYKTFEELLQHEKDAFEAAYNTKEYQSLKIAKEEWEKATILTEELREKYVELEDKIDDLHPK